MATPGQLQMFNKLEPNEMFSLGDAAFDKRYGERRRIHIYPDEKVPDAVVVHIWLEDHTLGNILRMELLRNKEVLFCGYKVPHPLNHMIEIRLQTMPTTTPEKVIKHAVKNLRGECKDMLEQFDRGVAALNSSSPSDLPGRPRQEQPEPPTESAGPPPDEQPVPDIVPSSPYDEGLSTSGSEAPARRADPAEVIEDVVQDQLRKMEEMAKLGDTGKKSVSPSYSPTSAHSGAAPVESDDVDMPAYEPEALDGVRSPLSDAGSG